MLLKTLEIHHIGPFAFPTKIDFEEDVTILTGPNDIGKSVVLRILSLISQKKPVEEADVNLHHLLQNDTGTIWEEDRTIRCVATYKLASNYHQYIPGNLSLGGAPEEYYIEAHHYLAPKVYQNKLVAIRRENSVTQRSDSLKHLPLSITLDTRETTLRSEIDIGNPQSKIEQMFVQLVLGKNAEQRYADLSPINRTIGLRNGEERLNSQLAQILPPPLSMQFDLRWIDVNSLTLGVSLKDVQGATVPIHYRGAGVRKIVALLTLLLDIRKRAKDQTLWILIDEPENALHADAQHYLRHFLEELAVSDKIQVIYATHSPAMLNPLHTRSIRLFKRTQKDRTPTSVVEKTPYKENFSPVRASLGMSPADSLLYAPITVIVEGDTELFAVPEILIKLEEEKIPEFQGTKQLLSMTHFLVGQGGSLSYWCRLARSQGATPIFFVDADMRKRVEQAKVREKCPDVSIVDLGESREIEDVVDQAVYFEALQAHFKSSILTIERFQQWLSKAQGEQKNLSHMATSKKIEYWLNAEGFSTYRKPEIMREVLEKKITDIKQQIEIAPFEELVKAMRKATNINSEAT